MDVFLAIYHSVATVIVCLCILAVGLKVAWNFALPYAMLRRGPDSGGWSAFPLIEVVPLIIAGIFALGSFHIGGMGPRAILVVGFAAILLSYVHLLVVAFIGGWIISRRRDRSRE